MRFRLHWVRLGDHVHVQFFSGSDAGMGMNGVLVFSAPEREAFRGCVRRLRRPDRVPRRYQ